VSEGGSPIVQLMTPVGPVAERFVDDERILCGIMGPFGSAKTSSCIRKVFDSPHKQNPGPDGVRRVRWCVVRDTYQQLETNVLNSWFTWFPKTKENWNGREMCHRLRFDYIPADGSPGYPIEIEMYFRAMGDQKAEQVLKGLELTGLWLNETDTLDKSVLRFGIGRIGRYPSAKNGGCQYRAVICDFNAPDVDNWVYDLFVDEKLPIDDETRAQLREVMGPRFGVGFHRQPGGRSVDPEPENIRNLPDGYYAGMMIGMTAADIRRFVDNEFGAVRNGQPVYPEYNDAFHCSGGPLKPMSGLPIDLGLDGGNTPALLAGQKLENGQIRTLRELVVFAPGADDALAKIGPRAFGREAWLWWAEHFGHCKLGTIWGDPAIWYGGTDGEESAWLKEFKAGWAEAGGGKAPCKPAPIKANRIAPRLEAVRHGLVQNAAGGEPGQLISLDCPILRRGFNNGYVIVRVSLSSGGGRWKDEPEKNDFSHVHDAKQYLDLGLTKRGFALVADNGERPRKARKVDFGSGYFAHQGAAAGRR
jgi:hypothetical protein